MCGRLAEVDIRLTQDSGGNMYETIGWIGTICFSICMLPQVYLCLKQGHARGVPPLFLWLCLVGEFAYIYSVIGLFGLVYWQLANYFLNLVWLGIIFYYIYKGDKDA